MRHRLLYVLLVIFVSASLVDLFRVRDMRMTAEVFEAVGMPERGPIFPEQAVARCNVWGSPITDDAQVDAACRLLTRDVALRSTALIGTALTGAFAVFLASRTKVSARHF